MENVKKTLHLAGGKRKENLKKTSRNCISQVVPKRHFGQIHVSYIKSLSKAVNSYEFGSLGGTPYRVGQEKVKKT